MPISTFDKVVVLWNTVIGTHDSELKIESINQIKDLIIVKEPSLLDNFYEEILGLLIDRSPEVRVCAVDFAENACKIDSALFHKSLIRLRYLVDDESFAVLRKLASTMMVLYRLCLTQAVKNKGSNIEEVESFQFCICVVEELIKKIDSPNGGFILMLIKLIESVIILQSRRSPDSDIPKMRESDLSLDQIPENLPCPCLQITHLEQYGIRLFNILIKMLNRDNYSSSHVHTLLTSLTNIGKQRPQFLNRVIEGFELTHVNMSDKLGEIQVNSIRKALKSNLISLIKMPGCVEFQAPISTLLTDLGATQQEITRCLPKVDETLRKRKRKEETLASGKRTKTTDNGQIDSPSDLAYNDSVIRRFAPTPTQKATPIKLTDNYVDQMSKELIPKLNIMINVTDLVLLSMMMLPDTMPPAFQSAYTPIAAAGTQNQIAHLSRLLANQLISAGYYSLESKEKREPLDNDQSDAALLENFNVGIVGNRTTSVSQQYSSKKQFQRPFNLVSVTKTLSSSTLRRLTQHSYERILTMPLIENMFERSRSNTHTSSLVPYSTEISNLPKWYFARNKILTSLPSSIFGGAELYAPLVQYCLSDIKNKFDILTSLVMQEFIRYKAFHLAPTKHSDITPRLATLNDYDLVLNSVLNNLITSDIKETYFGRLLLEAPLLTQSALDTLRSYCSVKVNAEYGFQVVRELMNTRPDQRKQLLAMVLDFSSDESIEIRTAALNSAKWILIVSPQYSEEILEFARSNLTGLLLPKPSNEIYPLRKLNLVSQEWNEELGRSCLYLFLSLLPVNNSLIHLLAEVFVSTCQVIKRTIMKIIDIPVKEMGMDSEELLNLVENCSSTQEIGLITRIIYILTDKTLPSPILVEKIKNLYTKFQDVRLYVPILKGLTKTEIIEVLPKLVQLSDKVVSEVFRRLLDVNAFDPIKQDYIIKTSPIMPEDLLIAVHKLEFDNVSLKYIIEASKMCFKEKQIFSQERLSIVIGHLIELPVIPTLFMRTLMQSFSMYPRMVGYVVNVLTMLIKKQVWKNASLWDGFIRCCVKLQAQSFAVLLLLPVDKLEAVFNSVGEFRGLMRKYMENCPPKQRVHVSSAVLALINSDPIKADSEQCPVTSRETASSVTAVVSERHAPEVPHPSSVAPPATVVKAEKVSIVKAVLDKEKMEEDRKKKERAKQILGQGGNKISFLPVKGSK